MRDFAIKCNGLNSAVGTQQDRATGSLIATTGFHTDITVLNDIEATNTVGAAHLIQVREHACRRHRLTIDSNHIAALER